MNDADKNRDQGRALKRATADLRCAARKLGAVDALRVLTELFPTEAPDHLEALAEAEGEQIRATDKPEAGKIYRLTGGRGVPTIYAGNTWAESEERI